MTEVARPGGGTALEQVGSAADALKALDRLGLARPRPVLVSVGGAAGLRSDQLSAVRELFVSHVVPVVRRHGGAIVDGGTGSGVMALMGEAVQLVGGVPLIGVAAAGTVRIRGQASPGSHAADLDHNHTAVLLVPGNDWGDESPWIATIAGILAGPAPSVTLVVNGGVIAVSDVRHSLGVGRPVVAVSGTGRTADAIDAAVRGRSEDGTPGDISLSPLVRSVRIDDGAALARTLDDALSNG